MAAEHRIHEHVEVNQRVIDGIIATLFWRKDTMPPEWFVEVQDTKNDDYFIIDSLDNPNLAAHEAFYHPFVYRQELGAAALNNAE